MTCQKNADMDLEELEFLRKQKKNQVLSLMKLIGHLFLRDLLTTKVIAGIVQDLACCDDVKQTPEEHIVECVLELLQSIGYTLEASAGKAALLEVFRHLLDLKARKDKNGKAIYSKRLQFGIQDLVDVRAAGWLKKVFKAAAKTKEEIAKEQERDINAQAVGKAVTGAEFIRVGDKPAYLKASSK